MPVFRYRTFSERKVSFRTAIWGVLKIWSGRGAGRGANHLGSLNLSWMIMNHTWKPVAMPVERFHTPNHDFSTFRTAWVLYVLQDSESYLQGDFDPRYFFSETTDSLKISCIAKIWYTTLIPIIFSEKRICLVSRTSDFKSSGQLAGQPTNLSCIQCPENRGYRGSTAQIPIRMLPPSPILHSWCIVALVRTVFVTHELTFRTYENMQENGVLSWRFWNLGNMEVSQKSGK